MAGALRNASLLLLVLAGSASADEKAINGRGEIELALFAATHGDSVGAAQDAVLRAGDGCLSDCEFVVDTKLALPHHWHVEVRHHRSVSYGTVGYALVFTHDGDAGAWVWWSSDRGDNRNPDVEVTESSSGAGGKTIAQSMKSVALKRAGAMIWMHASVTSVYSTWSDADQREHSTTMQLDSAIGCRIDADLGPICNAIPPATNFAASRITLKGSVATRTYSDGTRHVDKFAL